MIEHLTGIVLHKEEDHVVLDVNGVAYGLDVPARTFGGLGAAGGRASLWVKTHVTEGAIALFGFTSRGERELFETLLGVNRIGPRLALALLSRFDGEALVQIVLKGDARTLSSVPGIGAKTAEKLLFELKGSVKRLSAGLAPDRLAAIEASGDGAMLEVSFAAAGAREAVAALEALEVAPDAARRAVARAVEILGAAAPAEKLVREGLKHRHA